MTGPRKETTVNGGQQPCRAHRDDCPNGPEPHAYHPPALPGLPCCRQPGKPPEKASPEAEITAMREAYEALRDLARAQRWLSCRLTADLPLRDDDEEPF